MPPPRPPPQQPPTCPLPWPQQDENAGPREDKNDLVSKTTGRTCDVGESREKFYEKQGVLCQRVLTAFSPFPEALGQLSSPTSIPQPALPSCSIHIGTVREPGLRLCLEEEKSCLAGSHLLQQNVIPVHDRCSGSVSNVVLWTSLTDPSHFAEEKLRQRAETSWLSVSRWVGS